jgi:protease-4
MSGFTSGLRRISRNAGRVARLLALAAMRRPARQGGMWLDVTLSASLQELPSSGWGRRSEELGLVELLRALDVARDDARVAGVVLCFRGDLHGWSKAIALRRALLALREAGKHVVAWGESFTAEQYLVASAAQKVWLPESGGLHLVGLRTEQFFLRDLLKQLDVKPELVRIGSYKSAGEMVTRDGMSPESREQIHAWQGDVFEELVGGIAEGRGLDAEAVQSLIDEGPYPAREAESKGLCDGCRYPDELDAELLGLAPREGAKDPNEALRVPVARYFALAACDAGWEPLLRDLPRIAYVVADGSIRRGRGQRGITSGGFAALLEELEKDESIRGVVLRIDSPGGDAVASDLLHRVIEKLSQKKPVVVSMGDVAASGGYFMAAAGQSIFAERGTLTGSIGVFGGKFNFEGLYKKLGIAKDAVEHGARAGLLSEAREFTPDERAAVRDEMQSIYEVFLERVARGRGLAVEDVKRVAEGRIFSGEHARRVGLVDELGGPLEAIRDVCARAGLAERDRFVLELHPHRSRLSELAEMFDTVAIAP